MIRRLNTSTWYKEAKLFTARYDRDGREICIDEAEIDDVHHGHKCRSARADVCGFFNS